MRNTGRTLLATAALTALTASLAACGSSTNAPSSEGDDLGTGKGSITFSSHISGMQAVVDAYNASQSDIKVKFEEVPAPVKGGNAKLTNAIKAGNAPDVATVSYSDLPAFVAAGGLRPVEGLVKDTLAAMPEGIVSSVTFGEHTWGTPYDAPPMVFWYREDAFKNAGVNVPTTWAEFATAAEAIAKKKPGTYIASFWPDDQIIPGLAWQAGAQWAKAEGNSWKVNINDEPTKKVAAFWQDLIDRKLVKVEPAFSDEWANSLATGTVVGSVGASWSAPGLEKRTPDQAGKWRVAALPSWEAGSTETGMFGGSAFVIPKNSKNAKAAAAFSTWLTTSPEAIKARGQAGLVYPATTSLIPVAKASFSSKHFGDQDLYAVFEKLNIRQGWTWAPSLTALTSLYDGLGKVSSGGTIEQALESAQSSTVDALKSAGISVAGS